MQVYVVPLAVVVMQTTSAESCLLELEFTLKPGKRIEFGRCQQELRASQGHGHIRNSLYENVECLGNLLLVSEWRTRADAEKYLKGGRFRLLVGAIRVLGTLSDCRLVQDTAEQPLAPVEDCGRPRQSRVD